MEHRHHTRRPGPLLSPRQHRQPYTYPMHPYMPPHSPAPANSRMPVPYQPAHPPYMPATPSPNPHQTHHHFRQPYIRPGIPHTGGFPPYHGAFNYMRHPVPVAYGVPVMVPFPVYAMPMDRDQGNDDEDDRRERAFPPSGPRLFHAQRGSSGRENGRGAGRDTATPGTEGRFEVHHPDGTVEVGHDEPIIEEMNDGGEWQGRQDEGEEETADEPRNTTLLCLENIPHSEPNIRDSDPPPSPISQTSVHAGSDPSPSRAQPEGQDLVDRSENMVPIEDRQAVRRHRALSGVQAPRHTPEAAPFVALKLESTVAESAHITGSDPIPQRERKNEEQQVVDQLDFVISTRPYDSGRRLSADLEVNQTRKSTSVDTACQSGESTPQKLAQSQNAEFDTKPSTPVFLSNSEMSKRSPTAPLPSPEAAQVLDRLLEITGLSARQFMTKLERGEFHMDGAGHGESC